MDAGDPRNRNHPICFTGNEGGVADAGRSIPGTYRRPRHSLYLPHQLNGSSSNLTLLSGGLDIRSTQVYRDG